MEAPTRPGHTTAPDLHRPAPPSRDESILQVLLPTRRKIVPIRKSFVQRGHGKSTKPGPLAQFVTCHDERGLEAYLLVHGLSSAAIPHTAVMHAGAWARLLGLGDSATSASAKSAVSKVMRRLERRKLVTRSRRNRTSVMTLLREDGTGEEFTRPEGGTRDDRWLQFPHSYWTAGTYRELQLPGKAMLLIALSRPDGFIMPEQKAARWYGISPSTIGAGLRELEQVKILHRDWKWISAPRSEHGWTQEHTYTLVGDYATDARRKASKSRYGDPETAEESISDNIEEALEELGEESP